jgi:hypothetical protein
MSIESIHSDEYEYIPPLASELMIDYISLVAKRSRNGERYHTDSLSDTVELKSSVTDVQAMLGSGFEGVFPSLYSFTVRRKGNHKDIAYLSISDGNDGYLVMMKGGVVREEVGMNPVEEEILIDDFLQRNGILPIIGNARAE